MDLTICVVLDNRTAEQFKGVWPTWMKCKPWLRDLPWLIVCDTKNQDPLGWANWLTDWFNVYQYSTVPWNFRLDLDQRERMLTAWVKEVPQHVATPYFAKIDTDSVATSSAPWPLREWFTDTPAIIAPSWSYTKPKPTREDWGLMLDNWAEGVEELRDQPSLDLPRLQEGEKKIRHKRVCGWCQIVRTNFAYQVSKWFMSRMPVPSQDTYHWYCAARLGETIKTVSMKRHGWNNVHKDRNRKLAVEEIMGKGEGCCG